jgi:TetR/AcrR family transcriptional regulator, transcriptional repressor of aconitase
MPKVSQAHLDSRRQELLDAATACFSRDGFHRTTMQDIVRQSGLSAGAFYTYFKSKEDMIEAIATGRQTRERELILAAGEAGDFITIFRQLVQDFAQTLLDPDERQGRRLALQLWTEALRNPRILRTVRAGVDAPRKMLGKIVQAACSRGELPKHLDPDAMARVMIALFQGFALQLAWDPSVPVEPYVRAVETIFAALSTKPERTARAKASGSTHIQST